MHIFVPDTNFFLQCNDYTMLEWSIVTDDLDITIAVPRVVQKELDNHKDGGNSRRASRARKTSASFAAVVDSESNTSTTEVRGRKLTLELLTPRIRTEDFPDLDLQNQDDVIVAEALWVKRERPEHRITFLSNDTPALLTAKSQQLPFLRPPDKWQLPPEKDERDKKIDELQRQLKTLTSQHPELEFILPEHSTRSVMFDVTVFPQLTETEVDALMNEVSTQFPMATRFPAEPPPIANGAVMQLARAIAASGKWQPPSTGEIETYQNDQYPEWLQQTETRLRGIHDSLNTEVFVEFDVSLTNVGQQTAKNLLVSYRANGPIVFGVPGKESDVVDEGRESPLLIAPPAAPTGRFTSIAEQIGIGKSMQNLFKLDNRPPLTGIASLLSERRHDPNEFYWKPPRPANETHAWSLECDEFRHQHEPYTLKLRFRPDPLSEGTVSGAIRCTAHASNLPNQVELIIAVRVRVSLGDTMERAREELRFL
ncbi:PIN domain-containing protein [Paraburkholderia sp. 22B1P]|uniref:PIN domain-containing protein n=1 Tax=Paraburkholderia sp. 22B1P TaxID=3080498 RepID=UPI003089AD41|nr:PIN domain-containing protein [Paraburkholderia sp. 22B1P]